VLLVYHDSNDLSLFTDENTTILWEPELSKTPVDDSGVNAHFIVTVSPNEDLYHHFMKNAEMFFMPCPSELQVCLMGQIYRSFSNDLENCPTLAEIHQRVKKFGPYIPIALYWSTYQMDEFKKSQKREIAFTCSTEETLNYALQRGIHIMRRRRVLSGLSHHLARFVVKRDRADPYLGYDQIQYDFICEEVLNAFSNAIGKMSMAAVRNHMIVINQSSDRNMESSITSYLKRIFELSALPGLQWKCHHMQLQSESATNMKGANFSVWTMDQRDVGKIQSSCQYIYLETCTEFHLDPFQNLRQGDMQLVQFLSA